MEEELSRIRAPPLWCMSALLFLTSWLLLLLSLWVLAPQASEAGPHLPPPLVGKVSMSPSHKELGNILISTEGRSFTQCHILEHKFFYAREKKAPQL